MRFKRSIRFPACTCASQGGIYIGLGAERKIASSLATGRRHGCSTAALKSRGKRRLGANPTPEVTYQGRNAGADEAALNARIIQSADDIFQVVGVKGHILATTSRGAKMMLADRTDASAGKPWLDLWLGGERIAAERAFNEALAGRRGFSPRRVSSIPAASG